MQKKGTKNTKISSKGAKKDKNRGGRPTKYNKKVLKMAQDYVQSFVEVPEYTEKHMFQGKEITHYTWRVPYIEELAFVVLDVDDDTVVEWSKKYKKFSATIKRLFAIQKMQLQKISYDKEHNPAGAIFQLKVNHGMIDVNRNEHTGKNGGPIETKEVLNDQQLKRLISD